MTVYHYCLERLDRIGSNWIGSAEPIGTWTSDSK
jgi:hypothetical protein